MTDLFFDARDWRRIGLSDAQIRFLETLLQRTGGAQAPVYNLTEIDNSIQNITESSSRAAHELHSIKRALSESETAADQLISYIKRLEHRISQLEDAQ